jgi:tellurite methyltransferase
MVNPIKIGKRIAWLRKGKGYTQEGLAARLDITGQAISKWENGNAIPDTTLLPELAAVLETSIDQILTGTNFVQSISPYDKEYEKLEYYWGMKHSKLAEKVVNLVQFESKRGKHLLDLGSGEGRDAIYFARCGYDVDALEISLPGIEKIRTYSQLKNLSINAIHADMTGYEFFNDYDVIYSMGSLQFLRQHQRQKHFDQYKENTRIGGVNAHLIFVEKPFITTAPDWQDNEFFYNSGDLASYYYDWEIILSGEKIFDCNSSNSPHRHVVSYIIAKKPT